MTLDRWLPMQLRSLTIFLSARSAISECRCSNVTILLLNFGCCFEASRVLIVLKAHINNLYSSLRFIVQFFHLISAVFNFCSHTCLTIHHSFIYLFKRLVIIMLWKYQNENTLCFYSIIFDVAINLVYRTSDPRKKRDQK